MMSKEEMEQHFVDSINTRHDHVLKHNKRVRSIRNTRLPKDTVNAVDEAIKVMSELHEVISDGVYFGHNGITMDNMIELANAKFKLERAFTEIEVPERVKQ